MDAQEKSIIAGVTVPATDIIGETIEYARQSYEPYLFNHVMRSWLFAVKLAELENVEHDGEVVALGCLLHDITLKESFDGPRRFEVEAADIAHDYAVEKGFARRRAQLIWDSVALNSTPSIGLFKEAEVALCTAAICLDVVGYKYASIPSGAMDTITAAFPRLGMKKKMTRCFCKMAERVPEASYGTFLADFGHRFIAGYTAPSAVDMVLEAPFPE
jgi:hypothetical protein